MVQTGSASDKLGKYDLRGVLGRGAMGTVYDGWDPAIDRRVAIKTVKLTDTEDEETIEALARFKREAQAAGRLSHPNIVGVYDYGETADLAYIVMEFVEGRSLKSLLDQERRLPPAEAGVIMQQVLAGLGYSHARGVVHRDIKPANIMLTTEGQVKIADFGIARIESSSMTSVGTVMGTPAYMPPEQFLGESVDARSDIYAAGVMLFHLLTGERPYEGSMTVIMQKVLSPDAPPVASSRVSLPTVFDTVIAGAIAKAPAERYPSAGAFAEALRHALDTAEYEPDADATMVAPTSRGRAGSDGIGSLRASDATASMRRAAQAAAAASAPVAQPAEAKLPEAAAAERKKGPPVALFGGIAAAVLLAAGGAWFALQPGTPKPPAEPSAASIAPKPATPPPAQVAPPPPAAVANPLPPAVPQPTPEQVAAKVAAAIAGQSCSSLSASAGSEAMVQGLVGRDAEAQAHAAATQVAAGAPLGWSVTAVPDTYCGALDALAAARATPGGNPSPALEVTINGTPDDVHLVKDEPIAPRILLPNFPAMLTVDYLSNDGSMLHMLPKGRGVMQKPGSVRALLPANGEAGFVASPFGRDLVIAIASAQPLFTRPRPAKETMAQYLAALAMAVRQARARGVETAAGAIVVDTSER